jgi:hypothetical protein
MHSPKRIILIKVAHFSKQYFHTKVQDLMLSGTSVVPFLPSSRYHHTHIRDDKQRAESTKQGKSPVA